MQKSFDTAGRVSQISSPTGVLNYGYDTEEAISDRTFSNLDVAYQYDTAGRPYRVGVRSGSYFSTVYATYTYDAAGQLSTIARANGITSTYYYDLRGRVLKIAHTNTSNSATIAWETYDYDEAGRRISYTDQSGLSISYGYDRAGRLIQEKYAGGRLITYGYDAVGNRTSKYDSSDPLFSNSSSVYTYLYGTGSDAQNDHLMQVLRNGNTYRTYTYDNAGRVNSINGQSVTWTFDGKIASIGSTVYTYDADGNRIGKTTASATTAYLVDPTWSYPQVAESSLNGTKTRYEWWIGLLKEGVNYPLSDGLDTLRGVTGSTGSVVSNETYVDAFGLPANIGGQPYGLNSQAWDPETELYYLRARYYDPKVGRFLSQDPFEGNQWDPSSLHRYIYVANSPTNYVGPKGGVDCFLLPRNGHKPKFGCKLKSESITKNVHLQIHRD